MTTLNVGVILGDGGDTINGGRIVFDPGQQYGDCSAEWLTEAMGLIPAMAFNGAPEKTMCERCQDNYHFGFHPMEGGTVDVESAGVYRYPGDPDLYPYAALFEATKPQCVTFVYPYGITAFVEREKPTVVVRMD